MSAKLAKTAVIVAADYCVGELDWLSAVLSEMLKCADPDEIRAGFDSRALRPPDDPGAVQVVRLKLVFQSRIAERMQLLCGRAGEWGMQEEAIKLARFSASPSLHASSVDAVRDAVVAVKARALRRVTVHSKSNHSDKRQDIPGREEMADLMKGEQTLSNNPKSAPNGFYSSTDIAKAMNAPGNAEAIRKKLARLFKAHSLAGAAWMENADPAHGQSKILYKLSAVRPFLMRYEPAAKES